MTTTSKQLSPERTALQNAIIAHQESLADVKRQDDLLAGANKMLARLMAKWEKHATLDDEISKARAAQTVHAIERGERPPTEEPGGFAARKVSRDSVEAELESVREAIPLLESKIEDAKQQVEVRLFEIDLAAEAVLIAEAEAIVERYTEQLRECREMLYTLRYYGVRQVRRDPSVPRPSSSAMYYNPASAPTRQINMPTHVIDACGEDCLGASELKGGMRVRDQVSAAVAAHWTALHSDPAAKLEIGELPPPYNFDAIIEEARKAGVTVTGAGG